MDHPLTMHVGQTLGGVAQLWVPYNYEQSATSVDSKRSDKNQPVQTGLLPDALPQTG